jgi:DNA/RNA endonuclease YhcR with UshA esterase domain
MSLRTLILLAGTSLATSAACFAGNPSPEKSSSQECLTISEAQKHVGRTRCVSGTVVRVEEGNGGVTFLDFCPDYRSCPFTVVVFPGDLSSVGDVRQLQGRVVTIKGTIEEYDDRAEIILRHAQQLGESAAMLPSIPRDYDVERRGHYSAGTFHARKPKRARHKRQGPPISIEDPEEP